MRKPQTMVLTVSDSASRGERTDLSGPAARAELELLGCEVVAVIVVPDDVSMIREKLLEHSGSGAIDLIVTTGGTGLAPRDVTPEATREIIEKPIPGLSELMRMEGVKSNPRAALSRGVAGLHKQTLIINLPGSVRGVQESLRAVAKILGHALEVASGNTVRCGG
jgi:molybdenum cofactor synthesis domain-containing protein